MLARRRFLPLEGAGQYENPPGTSAYGTLYHPPGMDGVGHPRAPGLCLPAGTGSRPQRRLPPHSPVLPAARARLPSVLPKDAAPHGPVGGQGRPGGEPPPAGVPGGTVLRDHLQRPRILESLYPGAGTHPAGAGLPASPGRHLGSEQRISRRPGRLFPPPQRLETEAFIRRGGGGPAQGTGGDQPLPGKPAAGSAASLQSPELLSDGGRPGLLLPHVPYGEDILFPPEAPAPSSGT